MPRWELPGCCAGQLLCLDTGSASACGGVGEERLNLWHARNGKDSAGDLGCVTAWERLDKMPSLRYAGSPMLRFLCGNWLSFFPLQRYPSKL